MQSLRIAVVGAESTGTTTLATALAQHYGAPLVAEYGREYALRRQAEGATGDWRTHGDHVHIARTQAAREDAATGPLVICDSDLESVCVYEERYCGSVSPEVEELARARRYDLTILTLPDGIPYAPDDIRAPEQLRAATTRRLRELLERRGRRPLEVGGPHAERLARATEAIDELVRSRAAGPTG